MRKVAVIGAGFSGLSAATHLAHGGYDVTVFEKNSSAGGRARKFEHQGFVFDMGPSWYWMPDVFEKYFQTFGKTPADYFQLKRLDPSYRIFFGKDDYLDIPAGVEALCKMFDELESGSGERLLKFLDNGKYKYETGMHDLVFRPGLSINELLDINLIKGAFRLNLFGSVSSYIRKLFKNDRIIKLLEFPVLFLGATPQNTPALYTLMNYADMALGTWYPMGGMYEIVDAMKKLAEEKGVKFEFSMPVNGFDISGNQITGVKCDERRHSADYVVAGADYHHVEQQLLPPSLRRYSGRYWENRVLAPSCLLFYIGLNKRMNNLLHHNLFFDEDFDQHAREIYETPQWPTAPQLYVSCPSKTDPSVAPAGHENIMLLIPVAPGLEDNETIREKYFQLAINRLEKLTGEPIQNHIVYKRSYAHNDFVNDYHAFKGNAYGLANTLWQTANLKPSIINKKVRNLFYTGQLTVPGPGVPPSIISGGVVAQQLIRQDAL